MSGIKGTPSGGARVISKAAALMSQVNPFANLKNNLNIEKTLELFAKGELAPPHTAKGIREREFLSEARKNFNDTLDPRLWVNRQTENMVIQNIPGDDKMSVKTGPNMKQMKSFLKLMEKRGNKAFDTALKGGKFKGAATRYWNSMTKTAGRFIGTNVLPSAAATIAAARFENKNLVKLVNGYERAVKNVLKQKVTDRSISNSNSRLNQNMRKVANYESTLKNAGLNIKHTPWMDKGMKIANSYRKAGVGKGNKRRDTNIKARKRMIKTLRNERKNISSMAGNVRTGMGVQLRYVNAKAKQLGLNPGFWNKTKLNRVSKTAAEAVTRMYGKGASSKDISTAINAQLKFRKGVTGPVQAKNSPTRVKRIKG